MVSQNGIRVRQLEAPDSVTSFFIPPEMNAFCLHETENNMYIRHQGEIGWISKKNKAGLPLIEAVRSNLRVINRISVFF